MVDWPDGTQARPAMVGISDLYSGKMLAWRVGRSETSEAVRLTFGDAFRTYGLPTDIWLDNGRAYASKQVTGGQANRYRFKVLPEDSQGMLTALGIKVHWTKPYSGQSKPIERSWRDFAGEIAKHPAFEGAYTGPNTVDKPANYGARTVPLDAFLDVVAVEIAAWNARTGRRSDVCGGRLSFDQAFEASYKAMAEAGGIRKATPEQLRLCMLSSQPVTCARDDGAVTILGNRYQSEALLAYCGKKVFIRFDPQDLHGEVYAYDLSHRFIGAAPCILKAGFADMDAGRKQARALGDFKRATKELAKAEVRHTAAQLAEMHAAASRESPDATPEEPKIIRPVFGALALQARPLPAMTPEPHDKPNRRDSLDRLAEHWAATRPDHLRVVTSE
jgi:hypothetical protein